MALVVFTGGARSGKSAAAQALAERRLLDGVPVTAVVFGTVGDDAEFAQRVARHQADRPEAFALVEATDSRTWVDHVDPGALMLLDCMGTLVGMIMSEEWPADETGVALVDAGSDLPLGYAARVEERVADAVAAVLTRGGDIIVVTNEVGDGVVPSHGSGRLFRDVLGRANRSLVGAADRSYLVVGGKLIDLGDRPSTASWPED